MIMYEWHNEVVLPDMDITQVSGILVDNDMNALIYEEKGRYRIPGGHPIGDEAIEDTLIRECLEEVNTNIRDIRYVGYQEVIGDEGRDPYAQVRMVARFDQMGEEREDTDNGITYKRLLVPLRDVNKYLNWGEVGDEMIKEVISVLKEDNQEGDLI